MPLSPCLRAVTVRQVVLTFCPLLAFLGTPWVGLICVVAFITGGATLTRPCSVVRTLPWTRISSGVMNYFQKYFPAQQWLISRNISGFPSIAHPARPSSVVGRDHAGIAGCRKRRPRADCTTSVESRGGWWVVHPGLHSYLRTPNGARWLVAKVVLCHRWCSPRMVCSG